MADITKCDGKGCSKSLTCYRYTATSNEFWQSYFTMAPLDKDTGECTQYWPVEGVVDKQQ